MKNIAQEREQLAAAKIGLEDTEQAQLYLQQIAQRVQQKAHKQVAKVVSQCLCAVFEHPYELRIFFHKKRGKTEAEFLYYRDGHQIRPRMTSGGVLHVAALALRLTELVLALPPAERMLVLDEPFQGLSDENLRKMGVLIESLAAQLKVQFLIVTHDPALRIGKVVEI